MPMVLVPDSWGTLSESNPCHSPANGRFCSGSGSAVRLPEAAKRYFTLDSTTVMVPVAKLKTTRARPEGIANAEQLMAKAYAGKGGRRKPIDVLKKADGTLEVTDGNSTTAIAKKHGWKTIPAHVTVEKPSSVEHFEPGPKGECFRNVNKWNAQQGQKTDTIVHGQVTNGEGRTFVHAWAERGERVIDPTLGMSMSKTRYYSLLHAKPEATYTSTEAIRNQIRARHHGPWTPADLR